MLTQSRAIIEYLDETRTQKPSLLPKDPIKRAKARAIAEIVNSGMQPYQNTVTIKTFLYFYICFYLHFYNEQNVLKRLVENEGEEKKTEWVQFYLHKGFRSLEVALKETSGKYCVGDEVRKNKLVLFKRTIPKKGFTI